MLLMVIKNVVGYAVTSYPASSRPLARHNNKKGLPEDTVRTEGLRFGAQETNKHSIAHQCHIQVGV